MESLSFDLLQFLYHLSLAILVGGSLVLGTAVAPALFASRSRADAGTLFGSVLARFDGLAIFSVIALVITSVLKAVGFEVTGAPDVRLVLRWVALGALAIATLYSSAWANPVARQIRAATSGFDEQPQSSPARTEFARLHQRSRRAMSVAVVFGLLALFLG
ncbi:MAG: DUF4149 domain-containing protein [Chloroflexi bacterium]|nr:MAG: DUF4149 domain-containing protein [Chloroflexota bacterium]TMG61356.1 MAG: DUF4149 domain-containing protein [Chloroflexota bacterium]